MTMYVVYSRCLIEFLINKRLGLFSSYYESFSINFLDEFSNPLTYCIFTMYIHCSQIIVTVASVVKCNTCNVDEKCDRIYFRKLIFYQSSYE